MRLNFGTILAASVQARAALEGQSEKYPYMNAVMRRFGLDYTWEAHEVTTEDGYILTLFRISADQNGDTIKD